MNQATTTSRPASASFEGYTADSPSYNGRAEVRITGPNVELITFPKDGGPTIQRVAIKPALPAIAKVLPFRLADLHRAFALLPKDMAEYYGDSPDNVDLNRFKGLEYEDGTWGAIVMGGEICFMAIVREVLGIVSAHDLSFESVPSEPFVD
ncbi:MAG: hypothetical protein O9327_02260 [Polaromonas sp.]|nr:hypothetical protein [Polaromonas sp.]